MSYCDKSYYSCPVNFQAIVIPECLCRESRDFTVRKDAGSPIQTFGDDENKEGFFHVYIILKHAYSLISWPLSLCFIKLTDH